MTLYQFDNLFFTKDTDSSGKTIYRVEPQPPAPPRGPPPEEPGFCCLRREVFPASPHVCVGEGGAFFPDPVSAETGQSTTLNDGASCALWQVKQSRPGKKQKNLMSFL